MAAGSGATTTGPTLAASPSSRTLGDASSACLFSRLDRRKEKRDEDEDEDEDDAPSLHLDEAPGSPPPSMMFRKFVNPLSCGRIGASSITFRHDWNWPLRSMMPKSVTCSNPTRVGASDAHAMA